MNGRIRLASRTPSIYFIWAKGGLLAHDGWPFRHAYFPILLQTYLVSRQMDVRVTYFRLDQKYVVYI